MDDMAAALGEVIAERRFKFRQGSRRCELVVLIGRPVPEPPTGEDWRCPFQIRGLGDEHVRHALGVDSVQALQLCFEMIGAQLHYLARSQDIRLLWLGHSDLGFPMPSVSPASNAKALEVASSSTKLDSTVPGGKPRQKRGARRRSLTGR